MGSSFVVCDREKKMCTVLVGNLKGRTVWNSKIVLQYFVVCGLDLCGVWTGFVWFRIGANGRLLCTK